MPPIISFHFLPLEELFNFFIIHSIYVNIIFVYIDAFHRKLALIKMWVLPQCRDNECFGVLIHILNKKIFKETLLKNYSLNIVD